MPVTCRWVGLSEELRRWLYLIWFDEDWGTGLRSPQIRVPQNMFINSLPRIAACDDQEVRMRRKESEGWGEPLCKLRRLRERAALLIVNQRNSNAAVSYVKKKLLPQVRSSTPMWDCIQRTSVLGERLYFHFMIKHKLRRPTAGVEIEIDGQQPIEYGFRTVQASGSSVCCPEASR